MNFKEKFELVDSITSYGQWYGMYKEKLHAEGSKPEDYEHLKTIADEKLAKIMEIIGAL